VKNDNSIQCLFLLEERYPVDTYHYVSFIKRIEFTVFIVEFVLGPT